MLTTKPRSVGLVVLLLCGISCSGPVTPPEPKGFREKIGAAVPLTGEITLDGSAPKGIMVLAFNEKNFPEYKQQKELGGFGIGGTIKNGKFQFTTYSNGDGLPVGKYVVFFRCDPTSELTGARADAFNRKYGDPATSKYKAELVEGSPKDLGKIELSSK